MNHRSQATYMLIPIKPLAESKTRLSSFFNQEERANLVRCFMRDLANELSQSKYVKETLVCTRDQKVRSLARKLGFQCISENEKARGLSDLINQLISAAVAKGAKAAVITSVDHPLLSAKALDNMIEMSEPQCVAFTIWRGGGVSMSLRCPPSVVPALDRADQPELLAIAHSTRKSKAKLKHCDSFVLSFDVDYPRDLIECFAFLSVIKRHSYTFKFLRQYIKEVRRENGLSLSFFPGSRFVRKLDLVEVKWMLTTVITSPSSVSEIKAELLSTKTIRDPILFDRKRNFIVDGHHRLEALRSLGCVRAPVQFIDYDDPAVEAKKWIRAISRIQEPKQLERILKENGLEFEKVDKPVSPDKFTHIHYRDEVLRLIEKTEDTWQRMQTIARLEDSMVEKNLAFHMETDSDAKVKLNRKQCDALLVPFSVSKELTIEAALTRKPFAAIENRSVVPGRILRANVPLNILNSGIGHDEARRELERILSNRRVSYQEPGSRDVFPNFRRYEEDVFIFQSAM